MKGGGGGGGGSSSSRQARHSKVYTSRGPRDRRVRLSAITAIQFYDVQDRLGFDRPSEAVDWLMLKAKASIEALAQKPITFGKFPLQDLGSSSLQHSGVDSVNTSASLCPMERPLSSLSADYTHIPEFNYELGNEDPFPLVGSRDQNVMLQDLPASARTDCEFVPSSCLDQVVFSASLFSKQTPPIKRTVFSSAITSSKEDAPRKHRVLDWPFVTPPSIEF